MFNKFLPTMMVVFCFLTIAGCSSTVPVSSKVPSYKVTPPTDTSLYQYLQPSLVQHPNKTGVLPLGTGVDAFIARLAVVKAASRSIDLQYYIYHNDETGRILLWELIDAADRGVRVRMLLDDLTTKNLDEGLIVLASHPNIEIRLFNPSYDRAFRGLEMLTGFSRLNRRMHNKSLTVDNLITIVGGRNIGDEYFSKNEDVDFGDFDLLTIGAAVDKVSDQFDLYWNASMVYEIESLVEPITPSRLANAEINIAQQKANFKDDEYLHRLESSALLSEIHKSHVEWFWGDAEVVYDPPEKATSEDRQHWLMSDLTHFLSQAKQQVLLVSPYFVPTQKGTEALISAVQSGVKVTVVTNSLAATDVLAVHAGYQKYRRQLVENGVTIYEMKVDVNNRPSAWKGSSRSSLHAKTFVLDSQAVFVGSFNFDPRSAWINTELGLIFDNPAFASSMLTDIELILLDNSYRLAIEDGELIWFDRYQSKTYYAEPQASFWRKFMADFIGLFPIESQL
ncbi:phospholipase D family protein [Shewanella psychrotolerans]|uniref:phospholipase D family protein n=1 Tax=Shewanella psychrotolerans TaxID=2864206 RepID=UPI001C657F99|nr:phospholipase D family protein [Shewanella psychrotolerans]QYK00230.1 phospholipase D family protein [Shewanella psychrotolerans]